MSSAVTADGGPAKPDIVRGAPAADAPLTLIDSLPIGTVEMLEGTVTAVRSDGVAVVLAPGDPLFPGDLIATHVGAAAGLRLSDGTVLSIGGDSRVILDEAVFDPAGSAGSLILKLLEGVLVTVSGAIAKLAPDAMVIETPVAAIAVRGTALGLAFEPGNAVLAGALLPQSDPRTGQPVPGEISISAWGPDGSVIAAETIATPGLGFTVVAGDISIAALTPTAAARLFGPAMTPILDGTGIDPRFVQPDDDQGQRQDPDADLATRLAAFVTDAGGDGADAPAAVGPILLTASPLPGLDLVPIAVPMPPPLEPMALPGAPGPAGAAAWSNNALFDGFFELVTFEVPILFADDPRPPPFPGELLVGQDEPGVIDIFTLILPPIEGAPRVVLSIDFRSVDQGIPHTLPSGAEATALGGGNIRYDPAGQFRFLGQGQRDNDLFTYQVPDGDGGIVTGVVNVAIQGINDPPVAVDDDLTAEAMPADQVSEISAVELLANDFDPDRDDEISLIAVAATDATRATVALRADGSIAYDPRDAFRSLPKNETATDTFTYTIEDRFGGTATATVTVSIKGIVPEGADPGGVDPEDGERVLNDFEIDLIGAAPVGWSAMGFVRAVSDYPEPGEDGVIRRKPLDALEGDVMARIDAGPVPLILLRDALALDNPHILTDPGDNSQPNSGSAMWRTVDDLRAGDVISFRWAFDAMEFAEAAGPGANDFGLFIAGGRGFRIMDVRNQVAETGIPLGLVEGIARYTVPADGPLVIGFAAFDEGARDRPDDLSAASPLFVDDIRVNRPARDGAPDGYSLVDSLSNGPFETFVAA